MIRDRERTPGRECSLENLEDSVPGLRTVLGELVTAFPELCPDAIRAALGLPGQTHSGHDDQCGVCEIRVKK